VMVGAEAAQTMNEMTGGAAAANAANAPARPLGVRSGKVEPRDGMKAGTLEVSVLTAEGKSIPGIGVDLGRVQHAGAGVDFVHAVSDDLGIAHFADLKPGEGACAAVCTGDEGVMLIPESVWKDHPTIRVLADVNAVPPLGVEVTQAHWDGKEINGKLLFGALGIGGLKMKVHKRCVARLFERNDLVLDADEIMISAKELAS